MNREEIKNRLYYVADTIKMNADKFAAGETLENEDWVKAAKEFTACLDYLVKPQIESVSNTGVESTSTVSKDTHINSDFIVDIALSMEIGGRKFTVSKECLAKFMALPEKCRVLSVEYFKPIVDGNIPNKAGTILSICMESDYVPHVCVKIDTCSLEYGKFLETALSRYTLKAVLCGEFKENCDGVMEIINISHVSVYIPGYTITKTGET